MNWDTFIVAMAIGAFAGDALGSDGVIGAIYGAIGYMIYRSFNG